MAFGTSATIFRKNPLKKYKAIYNYIELKDIGKYNIPISFPIINSRYSITSLDIFENLPGNTIAYWTTNKLINIFINSKSFKDISKPKQGLTTSDNDRFLRLWNEVNSKKIGFGYSNCEEAKNSNKKWFPLSKGGSFRKWYGNNDYLVNYENDGYEMKEFHKKLNVNSSGGRIKNSELYFLRGITWTRISSGSFGVRYLEKGNIFSDAGCCIIPSEVDFYYIMGILCSKVVVEFLSIQNPTLNFQAENIANIPFIKTKNKEILHNIDNLVKENIEISKNDWDSFETSWDFSIHPLLKFKKGNIENSFEYWNEFSREQFSKLKSNEEELNRIFIDIYGVQDELTSEVEDKDITIRKADRERDIKSFISYAVGCMMGRYSLDEEGLAFAGGEFDINKYKTFKADEDAIIPITADTEYFEDDIVSKFVEFVKVVYGQDSLEENLNYIVDTECFKRKANESSRDCLRRYFLKGFMEDHLKVYQKRPIYWMFNSGKQMGLRLLYICIDTMKVWLQRLEPIIYILYKESMNQKKRD